MSELIHLILVKLITASTIISPILVVVVNYFILGMGYESIRFDGTMWLPFNANTPFGLSLALIIQCIIVFAAFCYYSPIICIYIGSCWCTVAFVKDISTDISRLRNVEITNLNDKKLTERICNFVGFHADVEELSIGDSWWIFEIWLKWKWIQYFRLIGEFNDIYEFIVFGTFLFGLVTIASSLIVFQLVEYNHGNIFHWNDLSEFLIPLKCLVNGQLKPSRNFHANVLDAVVIRSDFLQLRSRPRCEQPIQWVERWHLEERLVFATEQTTTNNHRHHHKCSRASFHSRLWKCRVYTWIF